MIKAPNVERLVRLVGNANLPDHIPTPEDAAKEIRRIWKLPITCVVSVPSEDYPSVTERRRHHPHPKSTEIKLAAINDLTGGFGVESAETANTGEYMDYVNQGDPYVPTVILWRGALRMCDGGWGSFIETCNVKFK